MKLDWDPYSDQPAVIKDRSLKKSIYKAVWWDSCKMILCNLVMYPASIINYLLSPVKNIDIDTNRFFGMSINLDKHPEQTHALIDDLGANNLLIRVPLSDIDNLDAYVDFVKQYQDKDLLINILQDRRHVEDHTLLKQSLNQIFSKISPFTYRFQIGNAINRKKWAFFSMDEFLGFYKVAYDLRNQDFPDLKLLGSSIIDFEYYFSIRTLFNGYHVKYDQFSILMYVDRRGAPENTQMGLNLIGKLKLMQAMLRLSPKSANEIVITETNWPITNTKPYAPTSEADCVSLEAQANFLVRYYLLALASGVVKDVYWHQLIAPGYGLIDNRGNELVKYPSYTSFKTLLFQLQGASFKELTLTDGVYCAIFDSSTESHPQQKTEVVWCNESADASLTITIDKNTQQAFSRDGARQNTQKVTISDSPIYLVTKHRDSCTTN